MKKTVIIINGAGGAGKDTLCAIAARHYAVTSVSAEEMLAAGQSGLKPEWRVIMFAYDYNGQQIVELDGVRYSVYRMYLGRNETIELYLERKAGV